MSDSTSPASSQRSLLHVEQATMQFGGLTALSSFSLDVKKGDLQGLIGPNGAGKTTAFNVMTGVYAPTSGRIVVDGEPMNGRLPHQVNRAGLARTFQNIRLFKELSALDNVKVGCLADDRPPTSMFSRRRSDDDRREGRFFVAHARDAWGNYLDWWRTFLQTSGFEADEARIDDRAKSILDVLGLTKSFPKAACYLREFGVEIILIKGATPIPFKLLTITAGFTHLPLLTFIGASLVSRSISFMIVGILFRLFGAPIKSFIDKYLPWLTAAFVILVVSGFVMFSSMGSQTKTTSEKCDNAVSAPA